MFNCQPKETPRFVRKTCKFGGEIFTFLGWTFMCCVRTPALSLVSVASAASASPSSWCSAFTEQRWNFNQKHLVMCENHDSSTNKNESYIIDRYLQQTTLNIILLRRGHEIKQLPISRFTTCERDTSECFAKPTTSRARPTIACMTCLFHWQPLVVDSGTVDSYHCRVFWEGICTQAASNYF